MSLDQHIAELRAELADCILTRAERAAMTAELEAALAERARRDGTPSLAQPRREERAAA